MKCREACGNKISCETHARRTRPRRRFVEAESVRSREDELARARKASPPFDDFEFGFRTTRQSQTIVRDFLLDNERGNRDSVKVDAHIGVALQVERKAGSERLDRLLHLQK